MRIRSRDVPVRTRPDLVATWSDEHVARRWWRLFPKRRDAQGRPADPEEHELGMLLAAPPAVAERRRRLSSLSRFWQRIAGSASAAAAKVSSRPSHGGGQHCDYQVVKLHHWAEPDGEGLLFALLPSEWVSATAYLIRNAGRVQAVRFLGASDRMLSRIARVGAVFPPAVKAAGSTTIPRRFSDDLQR